MPRPLLPTTLPIALLVSLGIIVVSVGVFFAMGRPLICSCGYMKLWHSAASGPQDSQHLFDWYTFTHVLHGPVFYLLIWLVDRGRLTVATRLVGAVFIESAWEIIENTPFIINRYRAGASADYLGDSIVNSVGDIAAMMVGFLLTAWLPVLATVGLFVAGEVALYVFIKDSLILNFISVLCPSCRG
jgi:hypothetical protein